MKLEDALRAVVLEEALRIAGPEMQSGGEAYTWCVSR